MKIVRWPDGTEIPLDEFNAEEYLWKSDDYEIVEVEDDYEV